MRILQVTPTYFADRSVIGGGERYVANLCRAVAAAAPRGDVTCDILSFGPERTVVSLMPRTDLHVLAGSPDLPAHVSTPAFHALLAAYDVIHVHQCLRPFGLYVAGRARLGRKVVIGTDHGGGGSTLLEPYPVLGDLFDAFHAQSIYAAHAFTNFTRPVEVIRGPVDDSAFALGGLPRDRSLIVAVGRILSHKGFETVIDNLPAACTLVIAGQPYDNGYLAFLKERAKHRRVSFEHDLDDPALVRLVQSAGLHVHASIHTDFRGDFFYKPELLGLAPLECMATGCPAITSRAGALAEFEALEGCRTFETGAELASLLAAHVDGTLPTPDPSVIRAGVVARYGLAQFGRHYLDMIGGL